MLILSGRRATRIFGRGTKRMSLVLCCCHEHVAEHILHKGIPHYACSQLPILGQNCCHIHQGSCAERLCCLLRGLSFCLSSMHSLKTLGLRGTSVCPRGMNVSLELPPSLERLCLSQVLPTNGLTLPAGCQVFLAGKACNLNDDKKQ